MVFSGRLQASGTVTNCNEAALRGALRGGGSVLLACDGIIQLTSPIIVAREIVLDGTGRNPSISGTTNVFPLFWVQPGGKLTLRNVAVNGANAVGLAGSDGADGQSAQGAAVFNEGTVVVEGCVIANHSAVGGTGADAAVAGGRGGNAGHGFGAAIHNEGVLFITNSTFASNFAAGGFGGDGSAGVAGQGGPGGSGGNGGSGAGSAIYNARGQVTIYDSLFASNRVAGSAAGIGGAPGGVLGLTGRNGEGGQALGAAIYNQNGAIAIMNSTFVANIGFGAVGVPGGVADLLAEGQRGSAGGDALGGGIHNEDGTVMVTNCTFIENDLFGGDGGDGGAAAFSGFGRKGGQGGNGGRALGGGVYNSNRGAIRIVNCTFSDHGVFGGAGGEGGPGTGLAPRGSSGTRGEGSGASVYNQEGVLILRNSILAYSVSGGNAGGSIIDERFNLSSDSTPALSAFGSRNLVDPLLGSFALNGGVVPTMTVSSNSPAVNAITLPDGNGAPPFDQRRATRVQPFDIGAYELGGVLAQLAISPQANTDSLLLTWPESAGEFLLQTATNLSQADPWMTVTNESVATNGWLTLSITPTNRNAYFRLIKR
jgi:hypothetical protein